MPAEGKYMARADRNRILNQLVVKVTKDAVLAVEGVGSVAKRGVSVQRAKDSGALILDVFLNVRRGCRIPQTAWLIQDTVKKRVESEAGAAVDKVNIHIQGVDIKTENKDA